MSDDEEWGWDDDVLALMFGAAAVAAIVFIAIAANEAARYFASHPWHLQLLLGGVVATYVASRVIKWHVVRNHES